jgi:glycogen operon protein
VIEKIPYLTELGVTVVELLPIHQFDPQEGNYWGYMTLHFFSPHQSYASGEAFEEFRTMVQAFHAAGIEVWLDVVYNHTTEVDETGPTYSFRGVDNNSYYLLTPDRRYVNDSGCGNTVRTGHPARAFSCSKASASGRARWAWMVFALILPRSCHALPTAR